MEETSLKEYAALSKLSQANRRANTVLIVLFVLLFMAAVYGMIRLYEAQQVAYNRRTAANNATQQTVRTMVIESIRYQTCIGVVPLEMRTPAAQRECFHKADLPGGLTEEDFITVPPEVITKSTPGSASSSPGASSSESSSSSKTPTSQNSSASGQTTSPTSSSAPSSSSQGNTSSPPPQPSISQRVTNFIKRLF